MIGGPNGARAPQGLNDRAAGLSHATNYSADAMTVTDRILARHLAPVLRRNVLGCIWASVVAVVLVVAFLFLRSHFNWPRTGWLRVVPLLGGLLPACVILPIGWMMRRSLHRDWRESGGRLCAHCGYNVSALPPAGTCPECGKAYDIERDAAMWARSGLSPVHASDPRSVR